MCDKQGPGCAVPQRQHEGCMSRWEVRVLTRQTSNLASGGNGGCGEAEGSWLKEVVKVGGQEDERSRDFKISMKGRRREADHGALPNRSRDQGRALKAGSNKEEHFVPPAWAAGGVHLGQKPARGRAGSDRWMETVDTRGLASKLGPQWLDPNSVVELTRLAWM